MLKLQFFVLVVLLGMLVTQTGMLKSSKGQFLIIQPLQLWCAFLKQELFQPRPGHCQISRAFLCTRPIFKVDVGQKRSFYKLFSLQMWVTQLFYPGSFLNKSHVSDRPATRRVSVGPRAELLEELHPYGRVCGHIV